MTAHRSKHPRRLSILVASTLAVLSLGACSLRGNGNEAVDTRELDSFHAVDLGGYYHPDEAKVAQVMRPSATLNAVIDAR